MSKSPKDCLPSNKKNKNGYILGYSMVKHVEGWKLTKSIGRKQSLRMKLPWSKNKVYERLYETLYLRKWSGSRNTAYTNNMVNSELPPERIAKSVIDVAKNLQTNLDQLLYPA